MRPRAPERERESERELLLSLDAHGILYLPRKSSICFHTRRVRAGGKISATVTSTRVAEVRAFLVLPNLPHPIRTMLRSITHAPAACFFCFVCACVYVCLCVCVSTSVCVFLVSVFSGVCWALIFAFCGSVFVLCGLWGSPHCFTVFLKSASAEFKLGFGSRGPGPDFGPSRDFPSLSRDTPDTQNLARGKAKPHLNPNSQCVGSRRCANKKGVERK